MNFDKIYCIYTYINIFRISFFKQKYSDREELLRNMMGLMVSKKY